MKAQYAIMRFAKYKGPEIGRIEAHDERTKEQYASNPDVVTSRSKYNYHLVTPTRSYRAEAERQIAAAGCRTRKDSVRVVEVLFTASPEFFKGKKPAERKAFFEESLNFIKSKQNPETIISAVVHMDEKTPHMHLSFVPLTKDGRLSAKDIVGNRARLQKWQDEYWKHMVKKWPDLERGESATETGRTHIPPRLFKEAADLNKQAKRIFELLEDVSPFNAKKNAAELDRLLHRFFPEIGKFLTQTKQYERAIAQLEDSKGRLESENGELQQALTEATKTKISRKLEEAQLKADYYNLMHVMQAIPPEIVFRYTGKNLSKGRELADEM